MAKELRTETLFGGGKTATVNADAEFRNDTSGMIFIRDIKGITSMQDGVAGDEVVIEISKAVAFIGNTNNQTRWNMHMKLNSEAGINTVVTADRDRAHDKWARGQLTLEPGESLLTHLNFLGGNGVTDYKWDIEYEF